MLGSILVHSKLLFKGKVLINKRKGIKIKKPEIMR